MRPGLRAAPAALVLAAATLLPSVAAAQDYRGFALTRVRWVETRPLERVPVDTAGGVPLDGLLCEPGLGCFDLEAGDVEQAMLATQDVGLTAWGLGVRGLSATALVRVRADLAGDFTWPRSEDGFDALLAYAQLQRGPFRVRLGRQETLSGLGFTGYDGGSVRFATSRRWSLEAYGGRSLARALNEPRNEALRGLVDFLPDQDAWLVGGAAHARPADGTDLTVRYQREVLDDRSALVSERASVDVSSTALRPVRIRASADYDVAFDRWGKANLSVQYALPEAPVILEATARRYVPYFDLTTIWGFFSPVPYRDLGLQARWSPLARWEVRASGGWRSYGDASTVSVLQPLEDEGWRVEAGVTGSLGERWAVDGSYRQDRAAGAFLNSGEGTLHFLPADGWSVSAGFMAFQVIEEYRLGDGRALGGTLGFRGELGGGTVLEGGASLFRHDPDGGDVDEAWNQSRGWMGLRFAVGEDPGVGRGGRP